MTTPLAGHISDLIGRKRMYLIGAVTMGLYAFVYFALLNTAIPAVIFIAIILSFIPHDMMYGPQAALIAECFSPRLRYSGSSLGFHLASIVAGGPAPIIATALLAATRSGYSVALYILACAVVSVVTTAMLPDHTDQDISQRVRVRQRRRSGRGKLARPRIKRVSRSIRNDSSSHAATGDTWSLCTVNITPLMCQLIPDGRMFDPWPALVSPSWPGRVPAIRRGTLPPVMAGTSPGTGPAMTGKWRMW